MVEYVTPEKYATFGVKKGVFGGGVRSLEECVVNRVFVNIGPIWGLRSSLSQFASGPGVNVHPLLSSGVRTPQYWRNKRVYGPVSVSSRDVL